MTDNVIPIGIHDHAQKLRDTWQARVLAESDGLTRAVVLIVLFHAYTKVIKTLLRVVFPGMRDIPTPYFSSGATILLNGKVACDLSYGGGITVPKIIYESTDELNRAMRDLADRLKLTDPERLEFTAAIQKWVVADQRVDHLGRKLHS
jgi:hypothetical protein